MATIHNSELSKELIDGAKIQTAFDAVPNQLAEKVVPVMEVNPKLLIRSEIVKSGTASNATSGTVYTTPSDKDFYIVACALSVIKDATSTSTVSSLSATVGGVSSAILSIAGITLTAQTETLSLSFPIPIKVDRGTSISIGNLTAVANIKTIGSVIGYEIANVNA